MFRRMTEGKNIYKVGEVLLSKMLALSNNVIHHFSVHIG